jgi:hypothetical protein
MTKLEMRAFLTEVSVLTRWEVTDELVAMWHASIGELSLAQARAAYLLHTRRSAAYLQPAHIWAICEGEEVPMRNATQERLEGERRAALTTTTTDIVGGLGQLIRTVVTVEDE